MVKRSCWRWAKTAAAAGCGFTTPTGVTSHGPEVWLSHGRGGKRGARAGPGRQSPAGGVDGCATPVPGQPPEDRASAGPSRIHPRARAASEKCGGTSGPLERFLGARGRVLGFAPGTSHEGAGRRASDGSDGTMRRSSPRATAAHHGRSEGQFPRLARFRKPGASFLHIRAGFGALAGAPACALLSPGREIAPLSPQGATGPRPPSPRDHRPHARAARAGRWGGRRRPRGHGDRLP